MQIKLLSTHREATWSGGITKEIEIYPKTSSYSERNFLWRLSSATVTDENSIFTELPAYDRFLMVQKGDVRLSIGDKEEIYLSEFECCEFDGGDTTNSQGKIIDYNLMIKKGNKGKLTFVQVSGNKKETNRVEVDEFDQYVEGYYISEGYAVINVNGQKTLMEEGNQLIITYLAGEEFDIEILGEAKIIRSDIAYNEEYQEQKVVKTKATYEDFICALKLSTTNFRGANFIFKSLKDEFRDKTLRKAIDKVERFYIPYIVFLLGVVLISFVGMGILETKVVIALLIVWMIADIFVVTPLIYLRFLPKPVKAHLKKYSEMTEIEIALAKEDGDENERVERILKKYKISGRNKYIDEE